MTVKRNIKSPLINQIKREIQHRIEEKVYRPEEKLPSIRTFAQEFKTSHETINIALNLLQQEGLIDKIPSRGSYVKDSSSTLDISRDKNGLIGLIINKSGTVNIDQMWPLYEQLIESIDTEIKKNAKILIQHTICYETPHDQRTLQNVLNLLDGIIVVGLADNNLLRFLRNKKIPIIIMLPHVKVNKMDVIDTNVYENFYETAGHLLDIGYNGVVYIDGPQKYYRQKERIRGIQSAYDEHGLEWKEEYQIFAETWGIEPIKQAVLEWMKENHKPNAFLCANDNHAIGALQAVQALGFNVPKDYGIVGNRNSNLSITTEPTLCSIDCHYPQLAEIAVEHLLKMIEDNRDSPISISLNGTLVIRNSIIVNS